MVSPTAWQGKKNPDVFISDCMAALVFAMAFAYAVLLYSTSSSFWASASLPISFLRLLVQISELVGPAGYGRERARLHFEREDGRSLSLP